MLAWVAHRVRPTNTDEFVASELNKIRSPEKKIRLARLDSLSSTAVVFVTSSSRAATYVYTPSYRLPLGEHCEDTLLGAGYHTARSSWEALQSLGESVGFVQLGALFSHALKGRQKAYAEPVRGGGRIGAF